MKRLYIFGLCGLLTLSLTACVIQPKWEDPTTTTTTTATATETPTSSATVTEEAATESSVTSSIESTSQTERSVTTTPATSKATTKTPTSSKVTTATPSTTKSTTAKPTTTTPPTSDFVAEVLRLVNVERASAGLSPLAAGSTAARNAASVRAVEIQTSFSHTRPNGSSCFTALTEAGVAYRAAGENIAYGYRTPSDVVNAWMNSSGHRSNILSTNFTHLAVAYHNYNWVQLFYTPV